MPFGTYHNRCHCYLPMGLSFGGARKGGNMREILFRGKHTHVLRANKHLNGIWVYGYLGDKNYINSPELEGEFLVDEDTVCQYTGLTDKNGRKIFENDILEFTASDDCKSNYIIFWNEVEWSTRETELDVVDNCQHWNQDEWQVVGNIFDNPELIGKERPEPWKGHVMSKFSEVN